jgi:ornithine cyclodeaminase/alanine dehydrogenase-like protein (mu-crystallin family)
MSQDLLYLSRADVEWAALPMGEIIAAVEAVFREKGAGRAEMPPKIGVHPAGGDFLHAMPAYVPSARAAGIKWVSNFAQNPARGLPTIGGLLILNDPETGLPTAVMDCTWITAKRTGAASAVAGKYLARPDSEWLAIIGCGVQGRSHLEAMLVQFPSIRRVTAYDSRRAQLLRFVEEMQPECGAQLVATEDCETAVKNAEIIVTATEILKQPKPSIRPTWIKPGAFYMAIDYDAQFPPEAVEMMDLFYTDDTAQMEYARTIGYLRNIPKVQGDLGEVVTDKKSRRTSPAQRAMSMQLGLAIEDMVTATRICERAMAMGIGSRLPL